MRTAVWLGIVLAVLFIGDLLLNQGQGHLAIQKNISKTIRSLIE
jgi:hypothetical protein